MNYDKLKKLANEHAVETMSLNDFPHHRKSEEHGYIAGYRAALNFMKDEFIPVSNFDENSLKILSKDITNKEKIEFLKIMANTFHLEININWE